MYTSKRIGSTLAVERNVVFVDNRRRRLWTDAFYAVHNIGRQVPSGHTSISYPMLTRALPFSLVLETSELYREAALLVLDHLCKRESACRPLSICSPAEQNIEHNFRSILFRPAYSSLPA